MQADRFTTKSQEALSAALALAAGRRNPEATPEHLLAALLEQDDGFVPRVLRKLGGRPSRDGSSRTWCNAARQARAPRGRRRPAAGSRGADAAQSDPSPPTGHRPRSGTPVRRRRGT